MAVAVVSRHGEEAIRRGHPWIWRSAVVHLSAPAPGADGQAAAGAIGRIESSSGEHLGCGILDPVSPLAVRVWTRGDRLDATLFSERLASALRVRTSLFVDGTTTAYRILNGEGDRVPGFVVDRYADVAVLRIDGDAARAVAPRLLGDLERQLRAIGITTLLEREAPRGGEKTTRVVWGEARERVEVREHAVPFVVDLLKGQKTGAFLDQRENRRRVGAIVERRKRAGLGTRVLNLFSYAGGFSLRAALAGGTVTSVDIATQAHAAAQESFRLAGLDPKAHAFVTADAFAWLDSAKKRGETFDVVISDPPSFAPNEKAKPKGIAAYKTLHRACTGVLADGGTFVAASCSSHVDAEDFHATLGDDVLGRDLRLLETHGPPADHPTLPVFSEGRYLKLVVLE